MSLNSSVINTKKADSSSIVQVNFEDGRWSPMPNEIFNDSRLDYAARGVLGWFLSRPKGWQIRIEAMRRANSLSEHSWQKNISNQLINAGYLFVSKENVEGKLVWKYKVFSVSQKPATPQNQGIENAAVSYTKLMNDEAKLKQIRQRSSDKATQRDLALKNLTVKVDLLAKQISKHD